MLDITASYMEPMPSRSLPRNCDDNFDCPSVTADSTRLTQYSYRNNRALVFSSEWVTSHTRVQFDEDSHPAFSVLMGTHKLEPISSYIKVTESSNRDDVAKTSDVKMFLQSLESTFSNREFFSTVRDQIVSAESETETLQHKDGVASSCTNVQSLKLAVRKGNSAYTPNPYLATVPDPKLYRSMRRTTENSTIFSEESLFPAATHSITMSNEATVRPSPFTLPKHQITLSTAPSLQIPSLVSIRSSTILEQKQTRKQAMADRRRLGGVWQRNKYFILATIGFFALVIMLAIVVAKIKR